MILLNIFMGLFEKNLYKTKLYFMVKRFLIKQNYVLRKLKSGCWKSKRGINYIIFTLF